MRLCYNEATTLKSASLEDDLKFCAAAGFHDMELRQEKLMAFLERGNSIREVKELYERYEMRAACLNALAGFSFRHGQDMRNLRQLCDMYCALLRDLGCRNLELIAATDLPDASEAQIHDETVRALSILGDIAAKYDVRLALEYMGLPNHTVKSFKQALEIIRDCAKPNVGLLLDTWHHHMSGSAADEILGSSKDEIFVVHISDAAAAVPFSAPRTACYMPGEGIIPNTAILQALQKIGYDDFVSVEVFDPALETLPPEEVIQLSYRKTADVLAAAGVLG